MDMLNSQDGDFNENVQKIEEVDDLIAELCIGTSDDDIRACLRSYQYGKTLDHLERDVKKSTKQVLIETAKYLKISDPTHLTKPVIAHLIICRIQNLLPDDCALCHSRYRVDIQEVSFLKCAICGQGVHRQC